MLTQKYRYGDDAFVLLTKLQLEHSARVKQGLTFVIAIHAMVRDWSLAG